MIHLQIYTTVRASLEAAALDVLEECCNGLSIQAHDAAQQLYNILTAKYTFVPRNKEETEEEKKIPIEEKETSINKYPHVVPFQLLIHFWLYDKNAKNIFLRTYDYKKALPDDIMRKHVQICVLQSLLDDLNDIDATIEGIDPNTFPQMQGEDRLAALQQMREKETHPLLQHKLQLEIELQAQELQAQQAQQAQQAVDARRFQQFTTRYQEVYAAAFFKNPWSTMKGKLERHQITTLAEIREYANTHPNTRTAKIIAALNDTWQWDDDAQAAAKAQSKF